ncbi:MAG: S9 family peptidase [Planctomycetes bacterium]|nr:S9 family peptidase [Planctomycetota bacterium]
MPILRVLASALFALTLSAQEPQGWQLPPDAITKAVTAPPPPSVSLSPGRNWLVLTTSEPFAGIDVVARPHLKLAGLRIDPDTYGPQLGTKVLGIELRSPKDGSRHAVRLAPGHWSGPYWTVDDRAFALTHTTDAGIELWVADPATSPPERVDGVLLNAMLGAPLQWLPDQQRLLVKLRLGEPPPARPRAPAGPRIEAAERGVKKPVRTFQDLLQDSHDEDLFAHYATSQLAIVDAREGTVHPVGRPSMVDRVAPSPDGTLLLVDRIERPFSFRHTYRSFPSSTWVVGMHGRDLQGIAANGLLDSVPIGGVPTGRRSIDWVPTAAHTLRWTEALDGGDPRVDAPQRDAVYLGEPGGEPRLWFRTEHRAGGVSFAADGKVALASEFDRRTRRARTWVFDATDPSVAGRLLEERSTQDVYGDPGRPVFDRLPNGEAVLLLRDGWFYSSGSGATPAGDRPFLDRRRLADNGSERLFLAAEGRYEQFVAFLDDEQRVALVRSETPTEEPSMVAVTLATGERRTILQLDDPAAAWTRDLDKRLIKYERADGVPLSGTLYLPPGHKEGQKHPTLIWAYPLEYTSASDAGQVRASPTRAVRPRGPSHLYLLLHGYAVFDDAAMPIVGPQRTANDTFVLQVQQNAAAAVAALTATGVVDARHIAVAGHSYGAFMTANLLAHTDLFAAGIARSGAYNRSLTPFGFQNEERTYWEARDVYLQMSPFTFADKIKTPLLLIHGEDDNNSGTFPIQSQRLFVAISGHGGEVRLCMLPHESHGYRARESVLHTLHEMCSWLDRFCKQ